MPEAPYIKTKPHPAKARPGDAPAIVRCGSRTAYAELAATSNFSFLHGASHPDELVVRAAELGYRGLALTDAHSLAGVVRAHVAAREVGLPLVVGAKIKVNKSAREEVVDEKEEETTLRLVRPPLLSSSSSPLHSVTPSLLLFAPSLASYARLCRLLTRGKLRSPKGKCSLTLHDVIEHSDGLLCIALPPRDINEECLSVLHTLRDVFNDDRFSIAAACPYGPDDRDRLRMVADLCEHIDAPMVATNLPLYHTTDRRPLQDVVTCIRHGCTLDTAGYRLQPNAERHLKPPEEVAQLFADYPEAVERSVVIARRCADFSLDELRYQYPAEVVPEGKSPMQHLAELSRAGAASRFPEGMPERVRTQFEHELRLIDELGYAHYFLTVEDIVRYARLVGILCQGRGAAANSVVCYCLRVTDADPRKINTLFERFVSRERKEPPDIDIDFEHERREEVIQYVYRKYGRDRAALTAEVVTYRGRLAVREVGKAMGLSLDTVDRLAKGVDWWGGGPLQAEQLKELRLDPADSTIAHLLRLSVQIQGSPRHLSQHVGGFVITQTPLCELVPIENASMPDRTIIEWDKDDIDALGMLKVDLLGLGMLTVLSKGARLLTNCEAAKAREREERRDRCGFSSCPPAFVPSCPPFPPDLSLLPHDDTATYDMICDADTVGVFQIESRAQMSMLPRLRPRCYYDLVIEVAIVRPGPIQGQMVHPYLRRRQGLEPVEYPSPVVERVLGKTLGVPLFQEQAMQLAIDCAGFSPDEADKLRRAVTGFRHVSSIERFEGKFISGMLERGYAQEFARRCFEQIKGFSSYGFPESHAASFALLAYASAYMKRHHPAAFAAALLNSQPMGFYAPAQIVQDAQRHGVEVLVVDANCSEYECTLEDNHEDAKVGHEDREEEPKEEDVDTVVLDGSCAVSSSRPSRLPFTSSRSPKLRLGLCMVRGLSERDARAVELAVAEHGPFESIEHLWRTSGASTSAMRRLAGADAFGSMGLDRQSAMWHTRKLRDVAAPLFQEVTQRRNGEATKIEKESEERGAEVPLLHSTISSLRRFLPALPPLRHVTQDYVATGLSLRRHPMSFLRSWLLGRRVTTAADLADADRFPRGRRVAVAGLCLCRQRPGTARHITFMTLEDETGTSNLVVHPNTFDRYRRVSRDGYAMLVHGRIDRQGQVVHIVASRFESLDERLRDLRVQARNFH